MKPMTRNPVVAIVGLIVGLAVFGHFVVPDTDSSKTGGSFYAAPGWTVQRAADLSVEMQRDDGTSRARADCAMKAIVGSTTWLEWKSIGAYGRLSAMRTAEGAC